MGTVIIGGAAAACCIFIASQLLKPSPEKDDDERLDKGSVVVFRPQSNSSIELRTVVTRLVIRCDKNDEKNEVKVKQLHKRVVCGVVANHRLTTQLSISETTHRNEIRDIELRDVESKATEKRLVREVISQNIVKKQLWRENKDLQEEVAEGIAAIGTISAAAVAASTPTPYPIRPVVGNHSIGRSAGELTEHHQQMRELGRRIMSRRAT